MNKTRTIFIAHFKIYISKVWGLAMYIVHNLDFEPFCPFQSLLLRLQIDSLCNVHCCNPHNCRKMVRIIQWILTREQIILHVRTPKWIAALHESYSCISRNMCTTFTFTFLFKIFMHLIMQFTKKSLFY